jgi:hypothetical protein
VVDELNRQAEQIKIYNSEKTASKDGNWRNIKISLKPHNPDFMPIELTCEEEGKIELIDVFLGVIE